jgi:hypothetical protein
MQVVESLTGLVVSAGNVAISMATIRSQAATAGLNAFLSLTGTKDPKTPATPALAPVAPTTSPNGVSSQPNAAALNDPGTLAAQHVLDQATNIKMLLTGGVGGKPDWDKIRASTFSDELATGMTLIPTSRAKKVERPTYRPDSLR